MLRDTLPVLAVMSRIIVAFSFAFIVPAIWAWFEDDTLDLQVWAAGFALTLCSGALLWWLTRHHRRELLARDGFLLVNLVWVVLPAYSAVPLMFSVPEITWT